MAAPFWPDPCFKTPPKWDVLLLTVSDFSVKTYLWQSSQLPPFPFSPPLVGLPQVQPFSVSSSWSVTSDIPLPSAWAGGRETMALITPDNHLWSPTVWPLPPSKSKYLLDIISPCRLGGWWEGGRKGGERSGKAALTKGETEARRGQHTYLPFPIQTGKETLHHDHRRHGGQTAERTSRRRAVKMGI